MATLRIIGDGAISGEMSSIQAMTEESRLRALAAAKRHSFVVRLLRGVIPIGVIVFVVVQALLAIGVSSTTPLLLSGAAAAAWRNGQITMSKPVLTGVKEDGKEYRISADAMHQSAANADRMSLSNVAMKFGPDVMVTSKDGVYDNLTQAGSLAGDIVLHNGGAVLKASTAKIDMKTNSMASDDPVQLDSPGYAVTSDSMAVVHGGSEIVFKGRVKSVIAGADGFGPYGGLDAFPPPDLNADGPVQRALTSRAR